MAWHGSRVASAGTHAGLATASDSNEGDGVREGESQFLRGRVRVACVLLSDIRWESRPLEVGSTVVEMGWLRALGRRGGALGFERTQDRVQVCSALPTPCARDNKVKKKTVLGEALILRCALAIRPALANWLRACTLSTMPARMHAGTRTCTTSNLHARMLREPTLNFTRCLLCPALPARPSKQSAARWAVVGRGQARAATACRKGSVRVEPRIRVPSQSAF